MKRMEIGKEKLLLCKYSFFTKIKRKKLIYLMNFVSAFRVTNAKNVTQSNGQYGTYVQHKCFFTYVRSFFSKHDDVH